jgi:hypothetical protein
LEIKISENEILHILVLLQLRVGPEHYLHIFVSAALLLFFAAYAFLGLKQQNVGLAPSLRLALKLEIFGCIEPFRTSPLP